MLNTISVPIIQAPMAGGVSTPALAAAVSNAGGLGFLAGGYKKAEEMREEIVAVRELTDKPFGVNVFVPSEEDVDENALLRYRQVLEKEAERFGVQLGEAKWDDDDWEAKLAVLVEEKVPVVSFTFGCPSPDIIAKLKDNGSFVIVTVTSTEEALIAKQAGANALCVQGAEAGGHRASFRNNAASHENASLLVLLQQIREAVDIPLIAAGGIMSGSDIAAVLAAGACAAQLGTAFLRCPESGANPLHKNALVDPNFQSTAVTRSFTGRFARGLVNRFLIEYDKLAPAAYPHIHHMTKQLRKAAAQANDPQVMSLWAGQGYRLAKDMPAGEIVRLLMEEWREMVQ
ncbi:nitronate monooxygenase [Parageobacillus thermoglucosidasius]|uniref:Probable nitronate monooxygenase n=1 Tax=Parageobacillus thermoglucosidasius TaxID=1426 RepID=A0AAN0YPU3_PARTM|nr:nitronate monooxygenase [Parageobacillus thermoglucosidasius]ALF10570.1 2-nitropropane dioxygenase [Parageobacillus thermoglucosidasius]ANZ30649.1 2-nitropropane dioxygenase [Parageobacillus thermoglucosidasius]APM81387.1 2-nitropropane dioxygenase [Parageobacillus thermoglucosidasius]KJX67302.1 2-nitropropane dioxygenase [Parageobacillus thermoglucosidasius]MED4905925.1 nitronate monooxygenase [Parageobacillus thermoglucosidasius]